MNILQKGYKKFCDFEELVSSVLLVAITILVFVSAVSRTVGHPLNWAVDISLLLFAWQVFIGGDLAVRNTNLIGVELLANKFPGKVQKGLKIVFFYHDYHFSGCSGLFWYSFAYPEQEATLPGASYQLFLGNVERSCGGVIPYDHFSEYPFVSNY